MHLTDQITERQVGRHRGKSVQYKSYHNYLKWYDRGLSNFHYRACAEGEISHLSRVDMDFDAGRREVYESKALDCISILGGKEIFLQREARRRKEKL